VPGKYDELPPEMRAQLEKAEATVSYLNGRTLTRAQDISDYFYAQITLLQWEVATSRVRESELKAEIRALRAACRAALGDAFPSP
jgi:hypothetical protein